MKPMKVLIYISIFLTPFYSYSQLEFAPVGARWTYETKWFDLMTGDIYYSLFVIESERDTLISGKVAKKLSCYTLYKDSNGNLQKNSHKNQFVYQEGYKVYHFVIDRFVEIFDFNPVKGQEFTYRGWNIIHDMQDNGTLEFKVLDNQPDSVYAFVPNKITAEITCSVSQGSQLVFYEKLGYLEDILFYSDAYCITDQYVPYTLRCYEDSQTGLIKFDSIDCDSIRPPVIRIATNDFSTTLNSIFPNPVSDEINIPFVLNTNQQIEISMLDLMGQTITKFIDKRNYMQGQHVFRIKTPRVENGVYFIQLKTKQGSWSQKLVLQK